MKTKTIYIVLAVLAVIIIAGVLAKKKEDNSGTDNSSKNTTGKIFTGGALEFKHKYERQPNPLLQDVTTKMADAIKDNQVFTATDSFNSDTKVFQRAKFVI